MDPLIGKALIEGGAGLIGNIASSAMSRKAMREYNKGQMELAKYQNDRNLELWNLQNEYNTPAAQMQRYRDAGLNPNLIYSQGSSGNASGIPETVVPHYQMDNSSAEMVKGISDVISNSVSRMFQIQQIVKQNQKTDAEIDQIKAVTNKINTETPFLEKYFSERNEGMSWQNNMYRVGYNNALQQNQRAQATHELQMKIDSENYDFSKYLHEFQRVENMKESKRKDIRLQQLGRSLQLASQRLAFDMAQFEWQKNIQNELAPYQLEMTKGNALNALARGLTTYKMYDYISNPDSWKNIVVKTKFGDASLGQILNGLSSLSNFFGGFHQHTLTP